MRTGDRISIDGQSPLTQFIAALKELNATIDVLLRRDDAALELLLNPESAPRVKRLIGTNGLERVSRVWTAQDARLAEMLRGQANGFRPSRRLERYLCRQMPSREPRRLDELFRMAVQEARADQTIGVLGPKLELARDSMDCIINTARSTAFGIPKWREYRAARAELQRAVIDLSEWVKPDQPAGGTGQPPAPDGPVNGFRWRTDGAETTATMAPAAWRIVNHLWQIDGKWAPYADLAPVVADDDRAGILEYSNARGHRDRANKFFRAESVPWKLVAKDRGMGLEQA